MYDQQFCALKRQRKILEHRDYGTQPIVHMYEYEDVSPETAFDRSYKNRNWLKSDILLIRYLLV